ncbi:MAG: YggS family pyridoxal phosphate-dependent enzyme [Holophagales bacterium]|nr:MAG: YggS family pyridoxal phosphate-dependent enzyme [Holophagales bacterium]
MPLAIADSLAAIEARIAAACARAGRARSTVTLVGASKVQPVDSLRAAFDAGLRDFGENRVQEGLAKAELLPAEIAWHLLGPLQSNKVRAALRLYRTFHAVDRLSIALDLEREAARAGLDARGFLEVNLGAEPTKHGFDPDEVLAAARELAPLEHLRLVGLMAIPPFGDDPEASRPWFVQLRSLRDDVATALGPERFPGLLSMGMSDDFEVAIEEGATHVRIGTALFGARQVRESS